MATFHLHLAAAFPVRKLRKPGAKFSPYIAMMNIQTSRAFRVLWTTIALLINFVVQSPDLLAQGRSEWIPQQTIATYDRNTLPPVLISDPSGTVHAFTSQPISQSERGMLIMYNQWTLEKGWTTPNDILLPPYNEFAWVMSAFLDKDGIIHLIFFGGHELGANIYYSRAPAHEAWKATAWTYPEMIGPAAVVPATAVLAGDESGNLTVVYSGNLGEGNGLYSIYSSDEGLTWSDPQLVYSTYQETQWPVGLAAYVDHTHGLHIVWNIVDASGANVTGYYARLEVLPSSQWSRLLVLDESVGLGIAVPSIIEWNDQLIVIYNNGFGETVAPVMWMRRSDDGGTSWSVPVQAFPTHRGRNGPVSLVIDSANTLHALFGQRTGGSPDIHGMWHSVWDGGRWSQPEAIVSNPQRKGSISLDPYVQYEPGFDPYDAKAIVVQGNILLVTWRTDPGASKDGVWYSYDILDAPALPTVPLPVVAGPQTALTPEPTHSQTSLATPLPESSPTSVPLEQITAPPRQPGGTAAPLLVGSVSAILLVFAIFVMHGVRQRSLH